MMKQVFIFFTLLVFASLLSAQEAPEMTVDQIEICTSVEERAPAGVDTVFSNDVEKLYCFTKISGAVDTTSISHVWYLNDEEKAKVDLSVKAKSWRTWSSKRIANDWIGNWKVDVVTANGDVLVSKAFEVKATTE